MTTYIFSGQGAQKKGMGENLFKKFPRLVRKANEILGYEIETICTETPPTRLNQTQYTQPALYVVNCLAFLEKYYGSAKKPDYLIGHSLGEYVALFAANVFEFEVGCQLVKKRGELMSQITDGGMAAVSGLTASTIEDILSEVKITDVVVANDNSPEQVIISGNKQSLNQLDSIFKNKGVSLYTPLNVSGPFHSFYMQKAAEEFSVYLSEFTFSPPSIPVIANVTARPYEFDHISDLLVRQITSRVKWVDTIRYLFESDEREFLEITAAKSIMEKILKQNVNYLNQVRQ